MVTKPKPVPARNVRRAAIAAGAATLATAVTSWGVNLGGWPRPIFDLTWAVMIVAWVATIATAHARYVTRYVRRCTKAEQRTLERVEARIGDRIRRESIIDEAERYLQEGR